MRNALSSFHERLSLVNDVITPLLRDFLPFAQSRRVTRRAGSKTKTNLFVAAVPRTSHR